MIAQINDVQLHSTIQPVSLEDLRPVALQPVFIRETEESTTTPFASLFDAAMNVVADTNRMQLEADQLQIDLATGRIDDILAVQMASDRAFTALNFTIQITNRVIESYREIMRMQM